MMKVDWDVAKARLEAYHSAQRDWWAHLEAHKGPYAETLACTHLDGVCYGDGAEIRERVGRRWAEYQEAIS